MTNRYNGYRILIVEDDDGAFMATKAEIEEVTGTTPLRAHGISDALDVLDRFAFDGKKELRNPKDTLCLVIIDQNLSLAPQENATHPDIDPKEGGLFLIRHVRERCPLASVGILTAYANTKQEQKFRAGKLNADFYWDKAIAPADFRSDICKQIDRFVEAVEAHNAGVTE